MSNNPTIIAPDFEIRCTKCNKLLAKNHEHDGLFEVKCSRCGTLNSVFEKMQEQVVITDPEGTILYTNELVENITGFKPQEIIGARPSLWGKQMPHDFYKQMWDVIKVEKKSIKVIVKNKRKDGSTYYANLRISPVLDVDGEVRFYVGIETVINNLKEHDQSTSPTGD